MKLSIQQLVAPEGVCFGCGVANPKGLHLQSFFSDDGSRLVATVTPEPHFIGWPSMAYGGYLAMLIDCQSNWTAIAYHYLAEGREPGSLPAIQCVTANLGIQYRKPTPMGVPLQLSSWVEGEVAKISRVICEIRAEGILTVKGDSTFARVDPARLVQKMAADRKKRASQGAVSQ